MLHEACPVPNANASDRFFFCREENAWRSFSNRKELKRPATRRCQSRPASFVVSLPLLLCANIRITIPVEFPSQLGGLRIPSRALSNRGREWYFCCIRNCRGALVQLAAVAAIKMTLVTIQIYQSPVLAVWEKSYREFQGKGTKVYQVVNVLLLGHW